MTSKEISLDAIAGTSCNAGLKEEFVSYIMSLYAGYVRKKAEALLPQLPITSCRTEAIQCRSGAENCKVYVPHVTVQKRDEASERY